MGRKPIGSKAMTPAERQRRRRQGLGANAMTKGERNDLVALIKKNEKLLKTAAKQRALELMADFEKQISQIFNYRSTIRTRFGKPPAEQEIKKAKIVIAERCRELGIPPEFSPGLDMQWYDRGQNASRERRVELRRVAKTQIDAMEAAAKTEIERASVESQTALISDGLTSEAAQAFLEKMPTADTLMPLLDIEQIKTLAHKG